MLLRDFCCILRQNKRSIIIIIIIKYKGKGKAVPLQAWSVPEGSRKLRFPDFMKRHGMVVKLLALRTGRL